MLDTGTRASPLIADYVHEIAPDLYGAAWTRRRIVDELTDHLLEKVDRFESQGLSRAKAEERAIEEFGSPRLVATTFAQSKGVGVPTTFTRYSGLAAALGPLIVAISLIWQEYSIDLAGALISEMYLPGMTLIAIALFGIYFRTRGQLGRVGRFGFRLIFIGFLIGLVSSAFWFGPGAFLGLLVLLAGLFSYLGAVMQADVLPKVPVVTVMAGIAIAFLVGVAGPIMETNTGPAATTSGTIVMTIGLLGIGRFLWSERVDDHSEWTEPGLPA